MSWLFSQALVAEYSADTSSGGEPCAPLNVMPTPHPFWHRDKTTDISRRSPSGLTCAVLTADHGAALLTSFRAAFPARTFPPPERASASAESVPASGPRWRGLSVKFDPASSSWKTHHSLFTEVLDWSSLTLPAWGMMQAGELWERTTPGLPTDASESGSGENWPTPAARDWKDSPGMAMTGTNPDGTERNRTDQLALAVYHGGTKTRQMYHTPRATDTGRGENPETFVKRNGDRTEACSGSLASQICRQMWQTPRAGKTSDENEESWKARNADGQVSTPPLTLAVKMWATPQARDFRSGEGHRFENPERTKNLNDQAAQTEASGQLNPDWVEWLMGWPIGWTASAPLATDKFRQWCASHGRP